VANPKPLTPKEMVEIRRNQKYRDQGLLDTGDRDAQDATDLLREVDRLNAVIKRAKTDEASINAYAELYWLRKCADEILAALDRPGRRPDIHAQVVQFVRKHWPTLDGALKRLRVVRMNGRLS
jgi:hypothetical protein